MNNIYRIVNLVSPNSIHFIQPLWTLEQWKIILRYKNRKLFCNSSQKLENAIRLLSGAQYVKSFNLGRSAIRFALESFELPEDSEVILPSFSCTGVITPVLFAGHKPVLVDVDNEFNIQMKSVMSAISKKTGAIILPHLSGKLARDFVPILEIAKKKKIKVIVDATQAFGLSFNSKWVGNFGDAGVYSFNGGKTIPGSSGGLLVSCSNDEAFSKQEIKKIKKNDLQEAERVFLSFVFKRGLHKLTFPITQIRDRINRISRIVPNNTETMNKYQFSIEEIFPIEAELVFSQLSFLPWVIEKRIRNSVRLIESGILQDLGFIVPNPNDCIFTKFLVTHPDFRFSKLVRNHIESNGIETEQSYTPLSMREFNKVSRLVSTPNTDKFWKGAFCIPVNPLLSTEDIDRIVAILKSVKSSK